MSSELLELFKAQQRHAESLIGAEVCRVAIGAEAEDDEVFVTLPNSEAPNDRIHVAWWRVTVGLDGEGNLIPRFPTRGDEGVAIYLDTGEICLIF